MFEPDDKHEVKQTSETNDQHEVTSETDEKHEVKQTSETKDQHEVTSETDEKHEVKQTAETDDQQTTELSFEPDDRHEVKQASETGDIELGVMDSDGNDSDFSAIIPLMHNFPELGGYDILKLYQVEELSDQENVSSHDEKKTSTTKSMKRKNPSDGKSFHRKNKHRINPV